MRRSKLRLIALLIALAFSVEARADEPTFEEIIAPTSRSHDASCALMANWVAAHPDDPRAARGLVWMAQLRLADQKDQLARPLFLRVRHDYPHTEWALHSDKGLADMDLAAHNYASAIARYERLAHSGVPFFEYLGKMAAQNARAERLRFGIVLGLGIAFLFLWVVRLVQLRAQLSVRAIFSPPTELLYPLPILLVLAAASFNLQAEEARGVRLLALGATLLLWLNGAALRARPPTGKWRSVHALFGLLQAAALLYVVIVLSGLWAKFHDTLVMGAD